MDDLTMVLFRNLADAGLAIATVLKCACVKLVRFFCMHVNFERVLQQPYYKALRYSHVDCRPTSAISASPSPDARKVSKDPKPPKPQAEACCCTTLRASGSAGRGLASLVPDFLGFLIA